MWAVKNAKLIDFLELNGCMPECEWYDTAFYCSSDRLRDLLDRYYIRYHCIPNRREY